ncbi:CBS domain-containing protein [Membranicola marinus]|uniref:CBS domain-containing protein n=1 Tax=Membranihabitans marinus TaxID=1227546 RepID=A0A953HKZ4_9BACT|nr:CBS domain-containing protein [Membranihabitans marinus]MBY5957834.1 CBS domain-containing protein [Membranihabitans marinus]
MGNQQVSRLNSKKENQNFIIALLKDLHSLKYMLENDWFEKDPIRIGAEQEMVLVDSYYKPNPIAPQILKRLKKYKWLTSELSKFNLEINLSPQVFKGAALQKVEKEVQDYLDIVQKELDKEDTHIILTGILPTLRKYDLDMKNVFPKRRYRSLLSAINAQRDANHGYDLRLRGIDELVVRHDSPLLEACNTSFQVHLQVRPEEYRTYYNIAQLLTGPILAVSANSPLLFGRRLWHETRIALFQQSIDTRTVREHMRELSPRVILGNRWMNKGVVELFQEDIARFRVLIGAKNIEDSIEKIQNGEVPKLSALQIHNGTVYRWNRPCYGISENGKPHLRVENRVLPAGPTVADEMANTAFWLGAMVGMKDQYGDVRDKIEFVDVRDNFAKAARYGIDNTFNWFGDQKISSTDLLKEILIPLAREGLEKRKIDSKDTDRYLDIISSRVEKHMTGARWQLKSYTQLKSGTEKELAQTILTSAIRQNQATNQPVHTWSLPKLNDFKLNNMIAYTVSEAMITDVFTVRQEDVIEMVAEMMIWKHIKQVPVENAKGRIVGMVSYKQIIEAFLRQKHEGEGTITVRQIMEKKPIIIGEETPIRKAIELMITNRSEALIVANEDKELLGILSDLEIMGMINRYLQGTEDEA